MKELKKRSNGLPRYHLEILYLLETAGGMLERRSLREQLIHIGYGNYCTYEALSQLEWKG